MPSPPPSTSSDSDLGSEAAELIRHLETITRRFLLHQKGADLSRNEATLLRFLARHTTGTMSDLSADLGLALSSTTGIVDRLVERKLVTRARSSKDRRTVVVTLTRRGTHLNQRIEAERIGLATGMLERLDESQRDELLALFQTITSSL